MHCGTSVFFVHPVTWWPLWDAIQFSSLLKSCIFENYRKWDWIRSKFQNVLRFVLKIIYCTLVLKYLATPLVWKRDQTVKTHYLKWHWYCKLTSEIQSSDVLFLDEVAPCYLILTKLLRSLHAYSFSGFSLLKNTRLMVARPTLVNGHVMRTIDKGLVFILMPNLQSL